MDLRYSDADEAFRKEVRAWLDEAVAALRPAAAARATGTARRAYDTGWQRQLHDAGYAGLNWPVEYGGRGLPGVAAARVPRGVRRVGRAVRRHQLRRQRPRRPDADRRGHRGAAARSTCRGSCRGETRVVPGLLRARGRLRPGVAAHPGGARRRRVRRQRPEDLEHPRPRRRLLRAARAHRPRRPEAQGHHLADPRHAPARRRGAADADHRRREPLLRGVPRRGARAGRRTGSARRTTAGGSPT